MHEPEGRRERRIAAFAFALLALAGRASLAVVVAEPPPPLTMVLSRLSLAPGDKQIEALVQAALTSTGRVKLVRDLESAASVGELEIARSNGATTLWLTALSRAGATLARVSQVVPPGVSLKRGAEALAIKLVAALGGARGGPSAETPRAESPRADTPRAAPPRADSPQGDRAPKDEDWSGPRQPFIEPAPNRLEFILGAEVGLGPWAADPARLIAGSPTYDLTGYAPAFTGGLDKHWRPGYALHGGWKFLGYGAAELALQFSNWPDSGRANLIGARFSGYPLKALWPKAPVELGLELGVGHAFVSSGFYDMTGSYLAYGLNVECPLNRWFGVVAYYRLYTPFLGHFHVDYQHDRSEPVSFTAYWNTLGIGLSFHPAISW